MELCTITSLRGCGGSRQGTEASQDRWPGDWEHRSQMEPEEQGQPPGPSLWGRSEDCGQRPRGGGPWARGHALTAGPFPRLPGLARAPGPAPKQERPMPGEAGSHTARPVQGQGLWGCLPGPPLVPESRRTSSGAGKAAPLRRLLLPSASLVPSACGHVAAACDSGCCALVQTGPRLREAGPGALGISGGATTQGLQVAPPCSPGAAGVRVRGLGTDTP